MYDRVCARFEAMLDQATWSDATFQHLQELSSFFSEQVRQKADYTKLQWRPHSAITEEEEWEALDKCTPEDISHACIHNFAIKAFQRNGMACRAYTFIEQGFLAFRPHDGDELRCYAEPFLAELTGNAKFEGPEPA